MHKEIRGDVFCSCGDDGYYDDDYVAIEKGTESMRIILGALDWYVTNNPQNGDAARVYRALEDASGG